MSILHLKSNTIADATGTLTVFNTAGSTETAAATNLVRPSDWNSAHAIAWNLGGNTAGAGQVSGTDVSLFGGNNITLSADTAASALHVVGPSLVAFLTTARASNDAVGLNTAGNQLHRVLQVGAKAAIVTPHWASNRAYGDPTHQWPPVSEMSFYYLARKWREEQAPHTDARWNPAGFSCDFEAIWGYGMHPNLLVRNTEYQQFALSFYKEAAQDMHATLTKR